MKNTVVKNAVQTFRAGSEAEAIALVQREMGPDATVLEVRRLPRRGLISWISSRQEVEVTATAAVRAAVQETVIEQPRSRLPSNSGTIAAAAMAAKSLAGAERLSNRLKEVPDQRIPLKKTVDLESIQQRLESLQQMIAELGRRTQARGLIEIPAELFPHYMTLIESDVEDEIARELIQNLQRYASPNQLGDTASTMALLTALVEQQFHCDDALKLVPGQRQVAMLVGPTGVGKTTTLAKLATRFMVQRGLRIGLITVDTYRVAAVEQLKAYAEVIELPVCVVTSAPQMEQALESFAGFDLVLIDTSGRSPQDDLQFSELAELVKAAKPTSLYLVLSLASGIPALRSAAERFAAIKPTSVVFTKLDETPGCGSLLAASRTLGLPTAYFTTGQDVPGDIEPANPCRAARLIVGSQTARDGNDHWIPEHRSSRKQLSSINPD